jgi:DNA polymerase-1
MLGVDRALKAEKLKSRLLLQIHDELIVEVPDGEDDQVVQILRKQMGSAYDLKVALDVNIGIGKNWDEGAH